MAGKVHDRVLLDALESLSAKPFVGDVWRTTWSKRDSLVGSSGGGRWDPPNSFEVLYTSTEPNGSLAEVYFHLSQAPIFSSSDVVLHHMSIDIQKVLYLDEALLVELGIDKPKSARDDCSKSQELSSAARFLEYQGLLVPSSRWKCSNLVLYIDQLDINECITLNGNELVNWPAWKEKNKDK